MTAVTVTLSALLRGAAKELRNAGIADAMPDARILAANALGLTREDMLREPHREIDPAAMDAFGVLIARRCEREPVSRILGMREFRSLAFRLGPDTLDPRPDSEIIVEAAVAYGEQLTAPVRVLDIGTGTGCLLLAVLNELPGAVGIGTDISDGAIDMAVSNAAEYDLSGRAAFVRTNWTDGIGGGFDLILSNPPYIETAEIATLAPEVSEHDPAAALDGGGDGLDAYRDLSGRLAPLLTPQGVVILEIGATQREAVTQIFATAGFPLVEFRFDYGGHARCLVFAREATSKWLTATGKKGLETP